jgi:hypothetical protein
MTKQTKSLSVHRARDSLEASASLSPGGDLWRYAPSRDLEGRALSDLMLLLPGLQHNRDLSIIIRQQLQEVLEGFGDRIQFADLNLRLGVLWVTVVSQPGLCGDVADAIRERIEGARVVCNYMQSKAPERLAWKTRFKRLFAASAGATEAPQDPKLID